MNEIKANIAYSPASIPWKHNGNEQDIKKEIKNQRRAYWEVWRGLPALEFEKKKSTLLYKSKTQKKCVTPEDNEVIDNNYLSLSIAGTCDANQLKEPEALFLVENYEKDKSEKNDQIWNTYERKMSAYLFRGSLDRAIAKAKRWNGEIKSLVIEENPYVILEFGPGVIPRGLECKDNSGTYYGCTGEAEPSHSAYGMQNTFFDIAEVFHDIDPHNRKVIYTGAHPEIKLKRIEITEDNDFVYEKYEKTIPLKSFKPCASNAGNVNIQIDGTSFLSHPYPFPSSSVDQVHAHMLQLEGYFRGPSYRPDFFSAEGKVLDQRELVKTINEVFRILKPGGVFFFSADETIWGRLIDKQEHIERMHYVASEIIKNQRASLEYMTTWAEHEPSLKSIRGDSKGIAFDHLSNAIHLDLESLVTMIVKKQT
mgnify:CR=1 FL=1